MNNQSFCCDGGDLQLFTDLGPQSATDSAPALYFYHPDHLGSTAMVTDLDGHITQNVVYIPCGEVFVEERNGSWASSYLLNAKELDEETGLYYYGARYLDPAGARWLSVDPMWEDYGGSSPYNYCMSNPVKLIDPDGRDEYEVNPQGYVTKVKESKYHKLFAIDKNGERTKKSINLSDKSILENLMVDRKDYQGANAHGKESHKGHYTFSKSSETLKLFAFLSDVSEVEWGMQKYKDGTFSIYTTHHIDAVTPYMGNYAFSNIIFKIHSHPGNVIGASGYDNDRLKYGDYSSIVDHWIDWHNRYINNARKQYEIPCHYVYHKKSRTLYQYTPWIEDINLGKVLNYDINSNIKKHKQSLYKK